MLGHTLSSVHSCHVRQAPLAPCPLLFATRCSTGARPCATRYRMQHWCKTRVCCAAAGRLTRRGRETLLGSGVATVYAPGVTEQRCAAQCADRVHQQQRPALLASLAQPCMVGTAW